MGTVQKMVTTLNDGVEPQKDGGNNDADPEIMHTMMSNMTIYPNIHRRLF